MNAIGWDSLTDVTTWTEVWVPWTSIIVNGTHILVPETTLSTGLDSSTLEPWEIPKRNAPCCGQCTLTADHMYLYYWPPVQTEDSDTLQNSGTLQTYVDETGFTMPSRILALQRSWLPCDPGFGEGLYYPPRTLLQGFALVPTTTAVSTTPHQSATPGQSIPKMTAPTSTANPADGGRHLDPQSNLDSNGPPTRTEAQPSSRVRLASTTSSQPSLRNFIQSKPPESITISFDTKSGERQIVTIIPPYDRGGSVLVVGGTQRITAAQSTRINDIPMSLDAHGTALRVGSTATVAEGETISTIGLWVSLNSQGIALVAGASQTLNFGSAISVNGAHTIWLDPGGTALVIDGTSTTSFRPHSSSSPTSTAPPVLALDGQTYTANAAGDLNIDGHVLTPGGAVTFGGTTKTLANVHTTVISRTWISLDPGATAVVVSILYSQKDSTIIMKHPQVSMTQSGQVGTEVVAIGGQQLAYNVDSNGDVVISGRTLYPGATLIQDKATFSLAADGSFMIVDGTTLAIDPTFVLSSSVAIASQRSTPELSHVEKTTEEDQTMFTDIVTGASSGAAVSTTGQTGAARRAYGVGPWKLLGVVLLFALRVFW
ncbi:hypothetical protein BDV96DRAFT_693982 [Lophiotrema nucula]|uniref:Uncharacterized protein n=1 Tax=Lophiotrema nucula TaxID=690887 RepID=A0A6A5YI66_9PLEO|nr:hypothetical protein BDV96DRAFT_693982 [Lophiotrema nucula]